MKKIVYYLLLILTIALHAQNNSVELRLSDGTFINSFNSIQQAYNAIPTVMDRAYLIELLNSYTAASENIPIIIGYKQGSSESNNIIIRPAPGISEVVIYGKLNDAVIKFDSCNYVTIDGRPGGAGNISALKIENADSSVCSHSVDIINSSQNIVLQYIHSKNAYASSYDHYTRNISIGGSYFSGNNNITIKNCDIDGGNVGVMCLGISAYPNNNILVQNCTIRNYLFDGCRMAGGTKKMIIEGCRVYQSIPLSIVNPTGISVNGTARGIAIIRKNFISGLMTSYPSGITARGIYVYGAKNATITIENNFISLGTVTTSQTDNIYGIYAIGDSDYNLDIRYNTILIEGHHNGSYYSVGSACIAKTSTTTVGYFHLLNNICINNRSGGDVGCKHTILQLNLPEGAPINMDYNTYYFADNINSYMAYVEGTFYKDITQYYACIDSSEQNSNFHNVSFVSSSDLHLTGASIGDNELLAIPVESVTEDYDGDLRSLLYPYKGADELNTPLSIETNQLILPACFSMNQNYPNPFNPSTTIGYFVKKESRIKISIYNLLGQKVKELWDGERKAGYYEQIFYSEGLSSGVYIYSINIKTNDGKEEFRDSKKMILIK